MRVPAVLLAAMLAAAACSAQPGPDTSSPPSVGSIPTTEPVRTMPQTMALAAQAVHRAEETGPGLFLRGRLAIWGTESGPQWRVFG